MRVDAARVFAPGCASARILLVCDWRLYQQAGGFFIAFPHRLIFNFDKSLKIRIFALIIVLSYAES